MSAKSVHQRPQRAHHRPRPAQVEPKMSKGQLYAQIGLVIVIIAGIVAMAFMVS